MSEDFAVNHLGLADANEMLRVHVGQLGQIIDQLNSVLVNMGQATQGDALPMWENDQKRWNQAYNDMQQHLNQHAVVSERVGQIFQDGDNQGGKIFS